MRPSTESKLFNRNYILVCLTYLTFCMSFHMLLPVLPKYLHYTLSYGTTLTGVIVAMYSIAALAARPISGFLVDRNQRKPIFYSCVFPFILCCAAYLKVELVIPFIILRLVHGAAFSIAGTCINTMAVDAIPLNKIGTGIGLFGIINSLSMALGPMLGMMIVGENNFHAVFYTGTGLAILALILGSQIRAPKREIKPLDGKIFSLDRFILKKAMNVAFGFILVCFPYGLLTNYISLYAETRGIVTNAGFFFTFMAIGLVLSRVLSSSLLNKGYYLQVVLVGQIILIASFLYFIFSAGETHFFVSGIFLGVGYGFISPAYQTMFLSLATPDQRGTANSTYFVSWDLGIGIAVLSGGAIAEVFSLDVTFMFGTALIGLSTIIFAVYTTRVYKRSLGYMKLKEVAESTENRNGEK